MPPRKNPTSFDGWLGRIIDNETETHGGRPQVAAWLGISEQSVNRRARGESPYLAREVEVIAAKLNVPAHEIVGTAIKKYGGISKLLAEFGSIDLRAGDMAPEPGVSDDAGTVDPIDNVTYLGHVTPELRDAADEKGRTPSRD